MPPKVATLLEFLSVSEWHNQVARKKLGTAKLYLQSLHTY